MHSAMNELGRLPVSERISLVQDFWDSIGDSQREMPIQEWHRELVKARLANFDGQEETLGLTRDEVWHQAGSRISQSSRKPSTPSRSKNLLSPCES